MSEFDRDGQLVPPAIAPRRKPDGHVFRIWSNEHHAWWRPGAWGYSPDIAEAGWFTAEETLRYLHGSACGSLPGKPKEVAVDGAGLRCVLELQREAGDV